MCDFFSIIWHHKRTTFFHFLALVGSQPVVMLQDAQGAMIWWISISGPPLRSIWLGWNSRWSISAMALSSTRLAFLGFSNLVLSQAVQCIYPHGECYELKLQKCNGSTSWTLHGLWPEWQNECEGPDFDENVLKDIHDEMEKKWPSCPEYGESEQEFWSHEWKKHGTCSGMGQLEYFKKALQMRDEYMNKCSKEGNLLGCSVCFGKNLTSQETCPTFTVSVWGILREGLRGSWLHGALAAALAAPSPPRLCCCKWHHTCEVVQHFGASFHRTCSHNLGGKMMQKGTRCLEHCCRTGWDSQFNTHVCGWCCDNETCIPWEALAQEQETIYRHFQMNTKKSSKQNLLWVRPAVHLQNGVRYVCQTHDVPWRDLARNFLHRLCLGMAPTWGTNGPPQILRIWNCPFLEVIHVELYWLMMPFGIISNLPQSTGSGSEIRAACSDLRKFGTASQFTWYPFWGIAKSWWQLLN